MQIVPVNQSNQHIYLNLAQAYEAEFSKIMHKAPDTNGIFSLDTELGGQVQGFLLYVNDTPAGHAAIEFGEDTHFEVCDFYVAPFFRRNGYARYFIKTLFAQLGGSWTIKQVAGAEHAVSFWRSVLNDYTNSHYTEDQFHDEKWGVVTRQRFIHSELVDA
ncbi:GNAT family N-acetyltransferase [Vibrio sp.]|nr:GNAT family N-acetyltransferase [Vibrio sp.]